MIRNPILLLYFTIFTNITYANDIKIILESDLNKFSNLVWENKKNTQLKEERWIEANYYCENLNTDNKKWRLPTFNELKSYANQSKNNNIIKDDYYWSSTENKENKNEILIYDISNQNNCEGIISEDNYYTLCVRQK